MWRKPLLYAREVIELMSAYPGRDFKMVHVYRYVAGDRVLDLKGRRAMREALLRCMKALGESGSVLIRPPHVRRGGYALYQWRK